VHVVGGACGGMRGVHGVPQVFGGTLPAKIFARSQEILRTLATDRAAAASPTGASPSPTPAFSPVVPQSFAPPTYAPQGFVPQTFPPPTYRRRRFASPRPVASGTTGPAGPGPPVRASSTPAPRRTGLPQPVRGPSPPPR